MAEINNWLNIKQVERIESLVGERPVVLPGPEVGFIVRRAISEKFNSEVSHQLKVIAPPPVMSCSLHLIDTKSPPIRQFDRRITALDASGKHEPVKSTSSIRSVGR